jgi:purine-cytosine permease-like protein
LLGNFLVVLVGAMMALVVAGWTTANPTIYRAGLAFQGVMPSRSLATMTLIAGAVATIAGAFPNPNHDH